MSRNRLLHLTEAVRLPQSPEPAVSARAFALYPVSCFPVATANQVEWRQNLYRQALEQARAVARPSLLERDLLGVWN
jgi:hypothetical protein